MQGSQKGDPGSGFTRYAWAVLAYCLLVIAWGYFLRISESGDGCGTDWPLCQGAILPSAVQFPTWVEFIHRSSSGLALLLVAAMAAWAFRIHPRGHAVRRAAGASLFLTLTESAFGALLVVFGLVAEDISSARIAIRPFHVTNTFLLMASLGLTAWWSNRGTKKRPTLTTPLRVVAGSLLLLAATGSWTGLASTAFPVASVSEGMGQYLNPEHLLIYLRVIHPLVAVVTAFLLVRLVATALTDTRGSTSNGPVVRRLAWMVATLTVTQLLVGPLDIVLLQPPALRVFHLFVADLLWLSVVLLSTTLLEESPANSLLNEAGVGFQATDESGE